MIDWDELVIAPCLSVFGEGVVFKPRIGSPYALASGGVFDQAYREVLPDSAVPGVNSTHPTVGVRDSDFVTAPLQRDRILRVKTGQTFEIYDMQPDSHGATRLLLNLVK